MQILDVRRYPLDHLFHTDEFRLKHREVLDYFGSDHFPMLFDLSYEPAGQKQQAAPKLDKEANEEAEEQVESAEKEQE